MWGRSGQKCPVGAKFPPFGGASIASGYTPDALAGARPRHPRPQGGERSSMQRKKTAIITARMTPGIKDLIQHQAKQAGIPYYRNQSSRGVCSVDRAAVRGNAGQQQPRCHHHCLQQRRICPTVHRRYGIYNLFPVCSTRSHGGCLFLQKI